MNHWFTDADAPLKTDVVKRFDARHWTVDFPRGAMASLVTDGTAMTVTAHFLRASDLVGLIWSSEDGKAHPAHRRETSRDYSGCVLSFRWQAAGLVGLDAVNGATLTIEGRDATGAARAWYVRLWNYAVGTGDDAVVTLDLDALDAGFMLPEEAQRVHVRDIDRMFVSLVPPDYDAGSSAIAHADASLTLSEIRCDGAGSVLAIGDAMVPEHEWRIATGYDDQYDVAPARIIDWVQRLGFRGVINHYIGMSHYMALGPDGLVDASRPMCGAALEWHRAFAKAAKAAGYEVIWSLSYEILDQFCPESWKQRSADGAAAATGYDPPSTLVSPASGAGVDYLCSVAEALVGVAIEVGLQPQVQVGEPWWWVTNGDRPCFYDDAARALLGDPVVIGDVRGAKSAEEIALLDAAGALLASSTQAIAAAVKAVDAGATTLLLAYLPGPMDPAAPEMRRANLPVGWAAPAFDVLQLEDYEWVTDGRDALRRATWDDALARLGYGAGASHYMSGFAADRGDWPAIMGAAGEARGRGFGEVFIWALPQLLRDGLTIFGEEDAVTEFEDVDFPIAIGAEASVTPSFSTDVVTSASGHEFRNANWGQARLRFDAGPGVRGEEELGELIAFFRARRGPAVGFRFRDPFDFSSNGMAGTVGAEDQVIGVGDGAARRFALVKTYGSETRRITRPVSGSVRVAVDGVELVTGWVMEAGGAVLFDDPPGAGSLVTAGFLFDVPVRFEEDRLAVNRQTFRAGEAVSVPLIEVREAA